MHGRLTHQPAPLGETGPDRLAASARRQAPVLFQRHCFPTPPGGTLPCRQAPRGAVILPVVPIAWRHQQAARRHTRIPLTHLGSPSILHFSTHRLDHCTSHRLGAARKPPGGVSGSDSSLSTALTNPPTPHQFNPASNHDFYETSSNMNPSLLSFALTTCIAWRFSLTARQFNGESSGKPLENLPSLCLPLQPLRFQPHHFTLSAPILWKTFPYD
ncbi:hypothetical protein DEO72_LG2g3137 [Vigna unguiculata]|uniref:Uncharacterized protein n=1 Tax=Vigna unguiculata TaxID=3917 RepID=A0A4D6L2V0_VIGUN|nr:hypothetical protein DEO72_LG2g3137 [Vigna unguiculata]